MEQTLTALAGILIKAIPTVILLLILHFYLKFMFFKPMEKVLAERFAATEGARKLAEESVARAAEKAAQYEAAIRAARVHIHQEMEELRSKLQAEQEQQAREARERAQDSMTTARARLDEEVARARQTLSDESEALAEQIAAAVLPRRAA